MAVSSVSKLHNDHKGVFTLLFKFSVTLNLAICKVSWGRCSLRNFFSIIPGKCQMYSSGGQFCLTRYMYDNYKLTACEKEFRGLYLPCPIHRVLVSRVDWLICKMVHTYTNLEQSSHGKLWGKMWTRLNLRAVCPIDKVLKQFSKSFWTQRLLYYDWKVNSWITPSHMVSFFTNIEMVVDLYNWSFIG